MNAYGITYVVLVHAKSTVPGLPSGLSVILAINRFSDEDRAEKSIMLENVRSYAVSLVSPYG